MTMAAVNWEKKLKSANWLIIISSGLGPERFVCMTPFWIVEMLLSKLVEALRMRILVNMERKEEVLQPRKKISFSLRFQSFAKYRLKRAEKRNLGAKSLNLLPVAKPKVVTYCRHYLKGRCVEPCCHFARQSCMKGDDCPFDHQLSKYLCDKYASQGFCNRGSDCLFSHEITAKTAAVTSPTASNLELTSPSAPSNSNSLIQVNTYGMSHKDVNSTSGSAGPVPDDNGSSKLGEEIKIGQLADHHLIRFETRKVCVYDFILDSGNVAKQVGGDIEDENIGKNEKKRGGPSTKEKNAKKKAKYRIERAEKRKLGAKSLELLPVVKPKVKTYCRHYLKGRCLEGEKCKFSHDTIPLTNSKPCCNFARQSCMKGDDCPFDHQLSKYLCDKYASQGFCNRGSDCLFSHEMTAKTAAVTSPTASNLELM